MNYRGAGHLVFALGQGGRLDEATPGAGADTRGSRDDQANADNPRITQGCANRQRELPALGTATIVPNAGERRAIAPAPSAAPQYYRRRLQVSGIGADPDKN